MIDVVYNNRLISYLDHGDKYISFKSVQTNISTQLQHADFYLIYNGKRLTGDLPISNGIIHVVPKLIGGKGGFGSMLRAIGAQIEKTTNREACRDLSGRRLRDINEEKRLKAWIDKQASREQEAEDKKQKKLERLARTPKHEFKDDTYDKERAELPERLEDAINQGMEAVVQNVASASAAASKRKAETRKDVLKKKKVKGALWFEDDIDISSSDDSSGASDCETEKGTVVKTVSGHVKTDDNSVKTAANI